MKFEDKYFAKFEFSKEQVKRYFYSASKDLSIAQKDEILEVKFSYAYTALIKAGIASLSFYKIKVKSIPGHHVKIIESVAEILKDESVLTLGNIMRSKRNLDLYVGGIEITEKECEEFLRFTEDVLKRIKNIIFK